MQTKTTKYYMQVASEEQRGGVVAVLKAVVAVQGPTGARESSRMQIRMWGQGIVCGPREEDEASI